jgi:hypothetical protein
MKKLSLLLFIFIPILSKSQCNINFNDLVLALKTDDAIIAKELQKRGYFFNAKESAYFCGNSYGYLFSKHYKDGVIGIDYLMPNSPNELEKFLNDAKYYGMKPTDSKINPSLGIPNNIYMGPKNLMMQVQSNGKDNFFTLYIMQ